MDKFKRIHHFLKETWLGFDAVAQLHEREQMQQKKGDRAMQLLKYGIKKLLRLGTLKELDEPPIFEIPKYQYCEEISKNKELIKLKVLDYVDRLVQIYFTVT